jgi:hypothetical protein
MFGRREQLLAEAHRRIERNPDKYVNHVYGEYEAGGTSWLYISPVPFDKLGFPTNVGTKPYPEYTAGALGSVPLIIVFGGTVLAGLCLMVRRRLGREEEACGFGRRSDRGGSGGAANTGGKTLLFSIVILAAVAAGAYSLSHKTPASGDSALQGANSLPVVETSATAPGSRQSVQERENVPGVGVNLEQQENQESHLSKVTDEKGERASTPSSPGKHDIAAAAGIDKPPVGAGTAADKANAAEGDPS